MASSKDSQDNRINSTCKSKFDILTKQRHTFINIFYTTISFATQNIIKDWTSASITAIPSKIIWEGWNINF